MMNCVEIQELFSAYIDHECTTEESKLVTSHIENCSICHEEFLLVKALVEKLNNLDEQETPEGFHEELMHKIHKLSPKKQGIIKLTRTYSVVAAAFLLCVIFGVIGSGVIMKLANQQDESLMKSETSYGSSSSESSEMVAYDSVAESPKLDAKTSENTRAYESEIQADMAEITEEATINSTTSEEPASLAKASDLAIEEEAVKDAKVQDTEVQDTEVQDTGVQDTGVQDTEVQDTGVKDTEVQDTGVQDTEVQDTGVKDTEVQPTEGSIMLRTETPPVDEGLAQNRNTSTYLVIVLALVILVVPFSVLVFIRKKH